MIMRISTNQLFTVSSEQMGRQQSDLFKLQNQMATGKRIVTPADDPVAASTVLNSKQSLAMVEQYNRNIGNARNTLALSESKLGNMQNVLQEARQLLVQAGNTTLTNSDRSSIANELNNRLQELLGLANSDDGTGRYLFSGYQDGTIPYSQTSTGATYVGDSGQRQLQVSASRTMSINTSGAEAFEAALTGNQTFATSISDPDAAAPVTNTGTGLIDSGKVINAAGYAGETFILEFGAGGGTYNVIQRTNGVETTVSTGNAFGSGGTISLASGAIQVSISGAPGAGDRFVIQPSETQNIFTSMQSVITALNSGATNTIQRTVLTDALRMGLENIDNGMDTISNARTSLGARLRELETLESENAASKVMHTSRVSELEDIDYAKAVSDLARGQLSLEAAQQSFVRVSQLSLFDYLQ